MSIKVIGLASLALMAVLLSGCAAAPSDQVMSQPQSEDSTRIKVFIYPKSGRVIDGTYVQIEIPQPSR